MFVSFKDYLSQITPAQIVFGLGTAIFTGVAGNWVYDQFFAIEDGNISEIVEQIRNNQIREQTDLKNALITRIGELEGVVKDIPKQEESTGTEDIENLNSDAEQTLDFYNQETTKNVTYNAKLKQEEPSTKYIFETRINPSIESMDSYLKINPNDQIVSLDKNITPRQKELQQTIINQSKLVKEYTIAVFEGEDFDLCGYRHFEARRAASGDGAIILKSRDRSIPNIPFRGFEKAFEEKTATELWPGCIVMASAVKAGGTARVVLAVKERTE